MKQILPAVLDHFGIVNLDLGTSKEIFLPLGFVTGGTVSLTTGFGAAPVNMHFVFDNCYVECIQSAPGDYLRPYIHSQAALHIIMMSSLDASRTSASLREAGFAPGEFLDGSRPANHGENKGTTYFRWFRLPDEILPGTLLGAIQHKTPELIYQPRRYRHENTACRVEALTVCRKTPEECEAFAAAWNRLYEAAAPGADRDHVIPRVELYDAAALEEEWGYAPEPDRSPYAGITFRVEDLGKVKALAEKAGFPYREGEGSCRFDFHRELGLSLSFLEG